MGDQLEISKFFSNLNICKVNNKRPDENYGFYPEMHQPAGCFNFNIFERKGNNSDEQYEYNKEPDDDSDDDDKFDTLYGLF